jgi:hypothetical protein
VKPQERHDAIFASRVEPSMKLLLMAVSRYLGDHGGRCIAAPETLAELTGLSRSTVLDLFGKGVAAGYLERLDVGTKAKETRILWDLLAAAEPVASKRGGARPKSETVQSSDGGVRSSDGSDNRTEASGNRMEASDVRIATVRSSDSNRPNIGPDPDLIRDGSGEEGGDRARAPKRAAPPDPSPNVIPLHPPDDTDTHLQIGHREIPNQLTKLLFGCRVGARDAAEILVRANIGSTRALLRIPVPELRFQPQTGRAVWDAVADHLRETWDGLELGVLSDPVQANPARAGPSRGRAATANAVSDEMARLTARLLDEDQPPAPHPHVIDGTWSPP